MKAANSVTGLIKALSYQKDFRIRLDSAIALGQIGDARLVKPLYYLDNTTVLISHNKYEDVFIATDDADLIYSTIE